jgi:hypothetical protein
VEAVLGAAAEVARKQQEAARIQREVVHIQQAAEADSLKQPAAAHPVPLSRPGPQRRRQRWEALPSAADKNTMLPLRPTTSQGGRYAFRVASARPPRQGGRDKHVRQNCAPAKRLEQIAHRAVLDPDPVPHARAPACRVVLYLVLLPALTAQTW